MATKSVQRSQIELKKRGYRTAIVERYNSFAHVRQDLFGFIDIVAIRGDENGVFGIQACAGSGDVAKHIRKLTEFDPLDKNSADRLAAVRTWLKAGNRIEVWSWAKRGGRGERKLWTLVATPVQLVPKLPGESPLAAIQELAAPV